MARRYILFPDGEIFRRFGLAMRYMGMIIGLIYLPFITFSQTEELPSGLILKADLFKSRIEYDSALFCYNQADQLFSQTGDTKGKLGNLLSIYDIYILQRKYPDAITGLDHFSMSVEKGYGADKPLKSDYLQVRGSYYLATGKQDSSKTCLLESIRIRLSVNGPDDTLLHYAYNKLGNLYLAESDYDSAFICHSIALGHARKKINPANYLAASSYQNLGIAAHLKGDFTEAEDCYTNSLKIKEQLFSPDDPALAKIYTNLGKFYSDLSKYDIALEYYDKAEKLLTSSTIKDDLSFAQLYINKGNIYTTKGDYEKSIRYLSKALAIQKDNLDYDHRDVLSAYMDLGFSYAKKGDTIQAIDYYKKALINKDNSLIIKVFRNLGNIYLELNKEDSAEIYYRLSIHYAKIFFTQDSYDLALCYKYYGEFLSNIGREKEAFYFNKEAAQIFLQLFGRKNKDLAGAYISLGEYYIKTEDLNSALSIIQKSIISLLPDFEDLNPTKNPSTNSIVFEYYLVNALKLKAKALDLKYDQYQNIDDLILSKNTILLSLYIIDEIRKGYTEEESQFILNNFARTVIDLGVNVAFKLYDETNDPRYLNDAFAFCEKGQAIILLSALRGLQAQSAIVLPENLVEAENKISRDLGLYAGLLYQEKQRAKPDESKLALWNDKVLNLRTSLDSVLDVYKEEFPEYFRLKYDYSVISSDSALKKLSTNQAILEYYLTDSLVYGFLLTEGKLEGKLIGDKVIMTRKLDSLQHSFLRSDYFNPATEDFSKLTKLSYELYTTLIKPFNDDIEGKRLIIVPDGELGYLSFDVLLSKNPDTNFRSIKDLPWLIRSNPISYSSSATIFFEQAHRNSNWLTDDLLAFAPSYDQPSGTRSAEMTDSLRYNLHPITGTKEEVISISEIFHTKKLFDENASETNFKELAGNYGILHLAMHTIIDNDNPLYSKLVFTIPEKNSGDDGYLNTYELFSLELQGQLAVLSACNTGSGKLERGEGIISLARGFFYAGIPSVVMTLWEIEDHSSADLMAIFYENLKSGLPNDIALQQAKIRYMENAGMLRAHPYFWAGYVNIGKTEPFRFNPVNSLSKWILTGAVILAISGILYFFSRRRVFFRKKGY